ncbi:MAG: 23S rRNA (pseudouridine(1915)-N(3))-methyltransferase RlmH [Candidatus Paracaedibacteraceae bacterium]|nr:23S rRNA (pseudouridine(1915)-N(3))-methyltransferase RlmH [Candidatus Paracaedibacteraceae bacterium]
MKYLLIAVSEMKAGIERDLFDQYKKRLSKPLSVVEIKQRNVPSIEAIDILKHITSDDWVCALDERGLTLASRELSDCICGAEQAFKRLVFVIGGADGLAPDIRVRANLCLSFGKMTWPHLLVRGLLAEQLYRCQQIAANHPYHRD